MSGIRRESNSSNRLTTSIGLLGLLLLLALTTPVALAAPREQDPVNGEQLWQDNLCKNCHGEAGQGMWAGPLAGTDKTAEEFITQVRTPRRSMPAFTAEKVSDQAITDIHAYLTTLTRPDSFTPADAGLASDAPEGQQLLVAKRCVACHTTTGPVRGFLSRGETPTAAAVIAQLRTPANRMPTFGPEKVSDEEAGAIADFLALQVSAPTELPQSGAASSLTTSLALVILGSGLVLTALFMRLRYSNS
jgi:mono/diheme cytochrome c family protein